MKKTTLHALLLMGAASCAIAGSALAENFNIPGGDLASALHAYTTQTGISVIVAGEAVRGARTGGARGDMSADTALVRILAGSGFTIRKESGVVAVVRDEHAANEQLGEHIAAATAPSAPGAPLETVTVTSSKIGGDVQNIPISITAMSQEQLTQTQTAGGPDLVKQVPNLTFSKTNFTGYNIQIRGIGTQAISVTTDPAVAVAFNDVPFLRNHFFEQEFFDVSQVEVLRGPQGTLYGRNATAGVVNLVSAKPTDQWEAQASVDVGNYNNRRLEGMLNAPLVGDKLDLRVAGEWTKRDGYSFDEETGQAVDGRDLWSGRVSLLAHPFERLTANFIWEHFDENDDRERSTKQLCEKDTAPAVIDGPTGPQSTSNDPVGPEWLEQGCKMTSLYAPTAFETPNASAVPFVAALYAFSPYLPVYADPYAGETQSMNLRVTASLIEPHYIAQNDTYELNMDFTPTPAFTLNWQTAYNQDQLYSTEDYNRFNTSTGIFLDPGGNTEIGQDGEYCDPQLGCSSRLVAQDVSREHAHQFYQEVRLTSNMEGPLNFVAGANYLNYKTLEDYFILSNAITLATARFNKIVGGGAVPVDAAHIPFDAAIANSCGPQPASTALLATGFIGLGCGYIDPNPLADINGQGHNYFRSENPYRLTSWATFGEAYYQVTPDVKLTGGLRYTDDRKSFDLIPSWTLILGEGYPVEGTINQEWKEVTGRFNISWTPKLDFTDQSMFYASYARGYKGGGTNPPGVIAIPGFVPGTDLSSPSNQTHPLTFKPEFNNAFEIGTKNSLLDGAMTLNGDVFLYKYQNYQISQIVDRTSVNLNFNATVRGAEAEATWEPVPGLRFNLAGGYEDATLDKGSQAIDLMDRTAGNPDWIVVKPFVTETSNCIIPKDVINEILAGNDPDTAISTICLDSYTGRYIKSDGSVGYYDPITAQPYVPNPDPVDLPGYAGFNPQAAPNLGDYAGLDYLSVRSYRWFRQAVCFFIFLFPVIPCVAADKHNVPCFPRREMELNCERSFPVPTKHILVFNAPRNEHHMAGFKNTECCNRSWRAGRDDGGINFKNGAVIKRWNVGEFTFDDGHAEAIYNPSRSFTYVSQPDIKVDLLRGDTFDCAFKIVKKISPFRNNEMPLILFSGAPSRYPQTHRREEKKKGESGDSESRPRLNGVVVGRKPVDKITHAGWVALEVFGGFMLATVLGVGALIKCVF